MKQKIGIHTIMLGVIVLLLVAIIIFKNPIQNVNAQADGSARHVFGLIGKRQGNREPLYLIDTREQVIMVYEYSVQGEGLGLVTVRNYKYDKQLEAFGKAFGADVEKVKGYLLKNR
ncbi:MAG: hypothetical protein ACUZ8O_14855 [Candidatus Anammoxibacter sp.]